MNKEILNKLAKVAKDQNVNIDLTKASANKTLKDLGLDSLTTIGIIVAVENQLGVRISNDALSSIKTLGGLVESFEDAIKNK